MAKAKAGKRRSRSRSHYPPAKPVGQAGLDRLTALWGPPKLPVKPTAKDGS